MPVAASSSSTPTNRIVRCIYSIAAAFFLLLPSYWLLSRPFPWMPALEGIALGTTVPLVLFALIAGFRVVCPPILAAWFEWGAIVLFFAASQAYVFNTALHPGNNFNVIGGLLPNADPSMYLSLADQWERGIRVVTPQTTREFFPCFLATMLWICQRDIRLIVSVFTLVTGSFAFLAWHEVRVICGWLGATLFLALVFFFYRCEGMGMLRTEQLGLWFALIALALMLRGLRLRREGWWNMGIFSLVMGLNTRAGAYLILPLLIVCSAWFFRRGRWGGQSAVVSAAAILGAMVLNGACYWIFFAPPRPTSNFWLCFYGMLTGGTWVTALNEIGLDYLKTNLIAKERGLALLKANPWLLIKGFGKACGYAWHINTFYAQPPMALPFSTLMKWLTPFAAIFSWLWALIRRRPAWFEFFVLAIFLGVIFSLPFAPPWDGGHRVYAVSDPFLYLAPTLLLSVIWRELSTLLGGRKIIPSHPQLDVVNTRRLCQAGLVVLIFAVIFIPLGLMLWPMRRHIPWQTAYCAPPPQGCPARELPSGFQIHLIADSGRTFVPWIRVSDFRKSLVGNLEKLRAPWILVLFNELPAGTTIGTAFHSNFFVIATDKTRSDRMSQRNPILNRKWHRIVYDNDYPISQSCLEILRLPKAPPVKQKLSEGRSVERPSLRPPAAPGS